MNIYGHYIGGEYKSGISGRFGDVFNPSTGEISSKISFANKQEVENAIAVAQAAFPAWAATSALKRARVMTKFTALLYDKQHELATLVAREHGKVIEDAMGSVLRGIEVAEFASGAPHLQKGEFSDMWQTA